MITEATTTQDLIATFSTTLPLGLVTFEEGCVVLDAIALFDNHVAGGKLGTWLEYDAIGPLRFVPTPNIYDYDDQHAHRMVCKKLAGDAVIWMFHQLADRVVVERDPGQVPRQHRDRRQCDRAALEANDTFTMWVVIDRATRVVWVECSPVQNQRAMHPRTIREAGEFPSSSLGTVSAHVMFRLGKTWRELIDSVREAYHEAKDLLDERS